MTHSTTSVHSTLCRYNGTEHSVVRKKLVDLEDIALQDIREIVAEVDGLAPASASELDLARLDALAVEYFSHADAPEHLGVWFRLFERFPESDGNGVFWSILHGIEAQPGSDDFVIDSIVRCPTKFPVLMVNRILNSGRTTVGEHNLRELLQSISFNESVSPEIRRDAERFLARQRSSD